MVTKSWRWLMQAMYHSYGMHKLSSYHHSLYTHPPLLYWKGVSYRIIKIKPINPYQAEIQIEGLGDKDGGQEKGDHFATAGMEARRDTTSARACTALSLSCSLVVPALLLEFWVEVEEGGGRREDAMCRTAVRTTLADILGNWCEAYSTMSSSVGRISAIHASRIPCPDISSPSEATPAGRRNWTYQ